MNSVVFIITRGDVIGGAQTHLLIMCKSFIEKGINVNVIVGGRNTILKTKLETFNIKTKEIKFLKRNISPFFDLLSLILIIFYLFKQKPDLVSAHSSKAGILSRLACFITKTTIVFTAHGWSFTEGVESSKRKLYIKIEKYLSLITDKIIAVSTYDYNLALKEGVCTFSKLEKVYNGIIEPSKIKLINKSSIVNIVMVARFDAPKDQLKLIKSIENIENALLYLIGDGPNLKKIEEYLFQNNLNNKVKLLGYVDNVLEVLTTMDIFVLISDYEGFPISTIEAMSVGLPVVISNVGGASEAVVNELNGFIVENRIQNINSALSILVKDRSLRESMGNNSLSLFKSKFSASTMVNDTLNIFNSAINCH